MGAEKPTYFEKRKASTLCKNGSSWTLIRKPSESGSSGLGLAIAKHIIEAHGMVIRVTSNLGIGTTFSITIAKP